MARFRIVKANITHLSLCPRGANRMPVIWKSGDILELDTIVKASEKFDEDGLLTAVVYAPEVEDAQGEIASAEVIKDMAYGAHRNGLKVDIRHDQKELKKEDAHIVESFLIQKGDPRFTMFKTYEGEVVDVTGGWATVIKIDNAELRKQYRSGEWNGVSMGGTAKRILEKSEDIEMTKEEMQALLKESNKELTASLITGLTEVAKQFIPAPVAKTEPAPATSPAPTDAVPILKDADRINPVKIKEYQVALKKFNLAKSVTDWTDEAQVAKYADELAALETPAAPPVAKDAEVERLTKELAEAQKRSNQTVPAGTSTTTASTAANTGLAKEDMGAHELGLKMAKAINEGNKSK